MLKSLQMMSSRSGVVSGGDRIEAAAEGMIHHKINEKLRRYKADSSAGKGPIRSNYHIKAVSGVSLLLV